MTSQQRNDISRYLDAFNFSGLFTDSSIGWDWPSSGRPLPVSFPDVDRGVIQLEPVAEKSGVRIFKVPPQADGFIMPSDLRKKLEKAVTPHAAEHLLIFTDDDRTRQTWLWTSRLPGKPIRHHELTWERGRSNELLLQKLSTIAFTLDEEDALDITGVVQRLHDNFDRDRLTKRFYDDFKRHKDVFQGFITGITDSGILAHYTSLMLNRLMFCYFLQQKGFLDGDQHYLKSRLASVRETRGPNQFHSFYRSFLIRLFREGFDSRQRTPELTALIGDIPYLNGGIFAEHPIERAHPDIQIPDKAFEEIFTFFDQWNWHLDDRPLGDDREINPEVLGYVFEKYTNQKEMGAYYTKEDITEYISKNTIIPFLLQKVAAKIPDSAWQLLRDDPDRYIYDPIRHGAGGSAEDWETSLPENIRCGLNPPTLHQTVKADAPVQTLHLRKDWNTPAPSSHGLPTEIWRETIARHQRCHELRRKLRAGEVRTPADLITHNLHVRQFMQDIIAAAPADLALALYKALRTLSVLDPTCGSGAFLFAALNILEPLYEGLLERFRALLADWETSGEKHPNWEKEIHAILDAVDRHHNEAYFIHKTIIIHNLYGVDIMEEAVEICKLRLFLKLAAQLEPTQTIEPLPDIDFNIRSGNTLVGYATRDEIKQAFSQASGSGQLLLQGIENSLDDYTRIMEQAADADRAFRQFQNQQDEIGQPPEAFRESKQQLETLLKSLRSELDRFLAAQHNQDNIKTKTNFKKWCDDYQPFHWFIEFYGIMNAGGFDVIIGNPPYVTISRIKYTFNGIEKMPDLYGHVLLKTLTLLKESSPYGMIVPLSITFSSDFKHLRTAVTTNYQVWISSFDNIPAALFEGVSQRCTICIGAKKIDQTAWTTPMHRWRSESRASLFTSIGYTKLSLTEDVAHGIPKLASGFYPLLERLFEPRKANISLLGTRQDGHHICFAAAARNFISVSTAAPPCLNAETLQELPTNQSNFCSVESENAVFVSHAILAGEFFFWHWLTHGDGFHVTKGNIIGFLSPLHSLPQVSFDLLCNIGRLLDDRRNEALVFKKNAGKYVGNYNYRGMFHFTRRADLITLAGLGLGRDTALMLFDYIQRVLAINVFAGERSIPTAVKAMYPIPVNSPKNESQILDASDAFIRKHYGFSDEELDFIINHDINYQMNNDDSE